MYKNWKYLVVVVYLEFINDVVELAEQQRVVVIDGLQALCLPLHFLHWVADVLQEVIVLVQPLLKHLNLKIILNFFGFNFVC